MLVTATHDRIPNVQFTACKIIKENFNRFDPGVFSSVLLPRLKDLSQETDKDVAYYAYIAMGQ